MSFSFCLDAKPMDGAGGLGGGGGGMVQGGAGQGGGMGHGEMGGGGMGGGAIGGGGIGGGGIGGGGIGGGGIGGGGIGGGGIGGGEIGGGGMIQGGAGQGEAGQGGMSQGGMGYGGGGAGGSIGGAGGGGGFFIAGGGFPLGQKFALKFTNGRCLYPENDQTSSGTKLVLPTEVCGTELAKFTVADGGGLKHDKTGFCVQPENDSEGGDDSPLVIAQGCKPKKAFSMTAGGSLKMANGKCVQPATGGTIPSQTEYMVLRDTCDTPETKFSIWGTIFHINL